MIIKITNLPVGIHAFSFEKAANELQLGEPFINNLNLDCSLDKSSHQIVVNCNLTISAKLFCDRCNIEFIKDFNSKFILLYLPKKEDYDGVDENVKFLSPTDDKIDLTEDVIDFANLCLPMKKLCDEDCAGLCTNCGINLNENKCNCAEELKNPVWESLLKLKDKLN
jgi:uncharacterized protein